MPESEKDKKESNDTKFYDSWTKDTYSSDYTTFEPSAVSGSIKVLGCLYFHHSWASFSPFTVCILLVPNITLTSTSVLIHVAIGLQWKIFLILVSFKTKV